MSKTVPEVVRSTECYDDDRYGDRVRSGRLVIGRGGHWHNWVKIGVHDRPPCDTATFIRHYPDPRAVLVPTTGLLVETASGSANESGLRQPESPMPADRPTNSHGRVPAADTQ